jgi:hypothetical protein
MQPTTLTIVVHENKQTSWFLLKKFAVFPNHASCIRQYLVTVLFSDPPPPSFFYMYEYTVRYEYEVNTLD